MAHYEQSGFKAETRAGGLFAKLYQNPDPRRTQQTTSTPQKANLHTSETDDQ